MTENELQTVLNLHKKWINGDGGGERADLVLAVQSWQEDSLGNYEALKKRLSRDFSEEVAKTEHHPFSHL